MKTSSDYVVVTRPILEVALKPLRERFNVYVHDKPAEEGPLTEEELIGIAREADALMTMPSDPVTARVMDACPRLKIIAQHAVGVDNIDLEAARERGIIVTNTPGVLTDSTADFAFALLLAVTRHVLQADRYVREGKFRRWETMLLLGMELRDKVLGIVGMGRIGQAFARRALGFGMKILYHNRRRINPTDEYLLSATYVSFEELLERSDVISIHTPLNRDSYHLFDEHAFARMKPGAYLINTARGAVVKEEALVEALKAGRLAGAGLDVFEHEPQVHPELLHMEQVVLAPHLGSATVEARTRMGLTATEAIIAALTGAEKIPNRIV